MHYLSLPIQQGSILLLAVSSLFSHGEGSTSLSSAQSPAETRAGGRARLARVLLSRPSCTSQVRSVLCCFCKLRLVPVLPTVPTRPKRTAAGTWARRATCPPLLHRGATTESKLEKTVAWLVTIWPCENLLSFTKNYPLSFKGYQTT